MLSLDCLTYYQDVTEFCSAVRNIRVKNGKDTIECVYESNRYHHRIKNQELTVLDPGAGPEAQIKCRYIDKKWALIEKRVAARKVFESKTGKSVGVTWQDAYEHRIKTED